MVVERGADLLPLALLTATLRDWLAICQRRVPVVYHGLSRRTGQSEGEGCPTPSPGVSMPAVTTRLERTKHDMRNGRKTGCPVSGTQDLSIACGLIKDRVEIPGCNVESTTFFAFHSSGVIEGTRPCLYAETSAFACSRPAFETSSVLRNVALA